LDALIFDFDGVVVDSEPIHLRCFRQVLAPHGITLTREQYYGGYLGFDDHDCFLAAFRDAGKEVAEPQIPELVAAKSDLIRRAYAASVPAQPGAVDLIRGAAAREIPLAVCSGALREEIVLAARTLGVLEHFAVIVSPEDVERGKPDPQGYLRTLDRLREITGRPLRAEQCIAVEDSIAGIEAARAAGMGVLALTASYPREKLTAADRVVDSLAEVTVESLEELLK